MTKIKDELVAKLAERYQRAERAQKTKILDEFIELAGCHRKHAIRVLSKPATASSERAWRGRRIYDEAMREALVVLWEASDRICGKRLRAALPGLIAAMERHGHLDLDPTVRAGVLAMSAATIDRLLIPARVERGKSLGRRRRGPTPTRGKVPIRTFADWNEPAPGFFEVDFVAHCGGKMSGKFIHTLVLTDIASGWTEMIPLLAREQGLVVEGFEAARELLPVPLRGIDTDNDSAFINDTVITYCDRAGVEFTRSRPRRKNDQAWVEQKNGALVRHLVGHDRFEGLAAAKILGRLYSAARLFANLFQPSFKLKHKERVGSKIKKTYYPPKSPAERLLSHGALPRETARRLRLLIEEADPIRLLQIIRESQELLSQLPEPALPEGDPNLSEFMASLTELWKVGEVRPTHRKKPRAPRYWRTRADPFAEVQSILDTWFEKDPDLTARIALSRLQELYPGRYPDGTLRTLQRRFQKWRLEAAKKLVFAEGEDAVLNFN